MDWIRLARDKAKWMYFVNAITNLQVARMLGSFSQLAASREGLGSIDMFVSVYGIRSSRDVEGAGSSLGTSAG
jgi:hypothetical protein